MNLNNRDAFTTRAQKVVSDFVMLAVGLMVTVSAVVMAGAIDNIEPRTIVGRPLASPQTAPDPPDSPVRTTRPDRSIYVTVSSQEAAAAMQALLSQDGPAVAAMLGEVRLMVVSTPEEYEAIFNAVNLVNMEVMSFGHSVELLDLRGPHH